MEINQTNNENMRTSIRGNTTKLIMLHALHKLKNDTLRVIELSIYHRSLLLSLTLEE